MSRNDPQHGHRDDRARDDRMRDDEMGDDLAREKGRMQTDQRAEDEIRAQQPGGKKPTGMKDKKGNQPR